MLRTNEIPELNVAYPMPPCQDCVVFRCQFCMTILMEGSRGEKK